ncbi:hypothetical protein I4U23_011229 [Adineta vaga]|nr:hypothetical protein I4U23_011229 [Adineta vaga]
MIENNKINVKDIYLPPNWTNIKFSLYLFGQIISFPCYLFVFYHLLIKKTARTALYNHATMIMLLFNFIYLTIGIAFILRFMKLGVYEPFSPIFCLTNQIVDRGIWFGAVFSMIWLSFERHILIFHSHWHHTKRGRWLFHYIPLSIFALYAPCFYLYMIFIYPCEHQYKINIYLCDGPWYSCSLSPSFRLFLTFGHNFVPFPLILILSGSVLFRVIIQKRRLQRGNMWRQNRKIILQFFSISTTYIIFALPLTVINIIRRINGYDVDTNVRKLLEPMASAPAIILPYATAITLPHLKEKLSKLIFFKRIHRTINPLPS